MPGPRSSSVGPGRVLVLAYGFFTLAAGARSGVQLATRFSHAPLAYALSGVAALVYAAGGVLTALTERDPGHRRAARALYCLELAGVLGVGSASLLDPAAFPDATVWSQFGQGYGFVPLALPLLGLLWTRRTPEAEPAGNG